jgi:hypothetical protein
LIWRAPRGRYRAHDGLDLGVWIKGLHNRIQNGFCVLDVFLGALHRNDITVMKRVVGGFCCCKYVSARLGGSVVRTIIQYLIQIVLFAHQEIPPSDPARQRNRLVVTHWTTNISSDEVELFTLFNQAATCSDFVSTKFSPTQTMNVARVVARAIFLRSFLQETEK